MRAQNDPFHTRQVSKDSNSVPRNSAVRQAAVVGTELILHPSEQWAIKPATGKQFKQTIFNTLP